MEPCAPCWGQDPTSATLRNSGVRRILSVLERLKSSCERSASDPVYSGMWLLGPFFRMASFSHSHSAQGVCSKSLARSFLNFHQGYLQLPAHDFHLHPPPTAIHHSNCNSLLSIACRSTHTGVLDAAISDVHCYSSWFPIISSITETPLIVASSHGIHAHSVAKPFLIF